MALEYYSKTKFSRSSFKNLLYILSEMLVNPINNI